MSAFSRVGDAIVTALNAGTFSKSFTAKRVNDPYTVLDTSNELRVKVFPLTRVFDRGSRGEFDYLVQIGVAAHKLIEATDPDDAIAEEDTILDVMEEIEQLIADTQEFSDGQLIGFDEDAGARTALNQELLQQSIFAAITVVNVQVESHQWRGQ